MNSRGDIRIVDAASMKLVSEITVTEMPDYMEMYLNGDNWVSINKRLISHTER